MTRSDSQAAPTLPRRRGSRALAGGAALVLVGAAALGDQFGRPAFSQLRPVIPIGVGAALVFSTLNNRRGPR